MEIIAFGLGLVIGIYITSQIEKHIDKWDGLIAAWLPGMAGEGVADVLFGDYNPTARLSYTWPKNINQVPINIGDKDYDPLFPFDHGLSYK